MAVNTVEDTEVMSSTVSLSSFQEKWIAFHLLPHLRGVTCLNH